MFKSLRICLTLWFVLLSSLAYILTTAFTGVLLHHQLTHAIDFELNELIVENLPNVHYDESRLAYVHSSSPLSIKPIRMLASIQVFDENGVLVHQSGAKGVTKLYRQTAVEVPFDKHHLRSKSRALFFNKIIVGYLQVQLPTDQRERAEKERLLMLLLTAPALLALLACAGYIFTTIVTKPIEQAFSILREFMINAGHELNTPLSVAQAVLDNLERNHTDPDHVAAKLSVLSLSINRMRSLVDDMMLLSKLEADTKLRQNPELIAFNKLLAETVEHVRPLFDEKKIELHTEEFEPAWTRGNASQLQQMIVNLLSNALNYNKPDGTVQVNMKLTAHTLVLTIGDTGIGISAEALPKVFDRFFRAEESRSRLTGGSGLGLSIVRAIVKAHDGEISITSEIDAGTKVTVTLPLEAQPS
ncbi:MAG: HAMP domain-containing histidine kinase [Cyanobacteria bacterium]|nr:HAMP domain-containing histidine kinase [Cyanobacteriota bacterium]